MRILKFARALATLLLFVSAWTAVANTKNEKFPAKLRYFAEKTPRKLGEVQRARLSAWAHRKTMTAFFEDHLPTEAVLIGADLNKWILVSPNRRVNPEFLGRIYSFEEGQIIHLELAGQQIALFLEKHSEEEAYNLVQYFTSEDLNAAKSRPMGRTIASEAVSQAPSPTGQESGLSITDYAYAFGESAATCGRAAIEGVEQAWITPFTMAYKTSKSAWDNPAKWWNESKSQMKALTNTIVNFREFAVKTYSDFISKSDTEKANLYCEFLASVAASGGGAAVAGKVTRKVIAEKTEIAFGEGMAQQAAINNAARLRTIRREKHMEPYRMAERAVARAHAAVRQALAEYNDAVAGLEKAKKAKRAAEADRSPNRAKSDEAVDLYKDVDRAQTAVIKAKDAKLRADRTYDEAMTNAYIVRQKVERELPLELRQE